MRILHFSLSINFLHIMLLLPLSIRGFSTKSLPTIHRILVPIASGSEEIETTCITDVLTRFGAEVTVASVTSKTVKMSRGLNIEADCLITSLPFPASTYSAIVLPGGVPGVNHLADCETLKALLLEHHEQKGLIAAICAAPSKVLSPLNLLNGSPCTGYPSPSFNELIEKNGGILSSDDVVYCPKNNLITSKGPATAMMFGLTVGEYLFGEEKAGEIAGELLMLEEGEE
ncbi:hypothetical protein TrVE_jg673 [Triparma verrucosa]|uniref:DJ-1/PfpI domain-containing protein n=1 Tax=Triparma verrucosa TaxID=1606542 RepID=A0A9W7C2J2_9STRA|nr:hypothetical protein TrVE_jg673 [Triparma verrucosa]